MAYIINTLNFIKNTSFDDSRELNTPIELLEQFILYANDVIPEKMKRPAANVAVYQSKERPLKRAGAIIDGYSAVILDVDESSLGELERVLDIIDEKHLMALLYETAQSTAEELRYRIIFPLKEMVKTADYKKLVLATANMLDLTIDPTSYAAGQLFFLPCKGAEEHEYVCEIIEGDLLSYEALSSFFVKGPIKPISKKTSGPNQPDKVPSIQLARDIIANKYDGLLMFTEGRFYSYQNNVWLECTIDSMQNLLVNDSVYQANFGSTGDVYQVVDAMRCISLKEAFPMTIPLINTQNTAINVLTGQQIPHHFDHYSRSQLNIDFDATATPVRWLQFLDEVFGCDQDKDQKIALIQEMMGYLLLPTTRYEKAFWFIGNGSNGKSTLLNVIEQLVGSENVSAVPLNELAAKFSTVQLQGKLVNISGELDVNGKLNYGKMKSIVSGDLIECERKGQQGFTFRPYAKLITAMNHTPQIDDLSNGFFRRLIIIEFNRRFEEHEMDRSLITTLKGELAGILNWAISGVQRLEANKAFTIAESSVKALSGVEYSSDPILQFMTGWEVGQLKTLKKEVYTSFKTFCDDHGIKRVADAITFGKRLRSLGIESKKSSGETYYVLQPVFTVPTRVRSPATSRQPAKVAVNDVTVTPTLEEEMFG
jgi:putative DNA primase/helicase